MASGWFDVDLSPLGAGEQLHECAKRYGELALDAIFTSDLQRAYKTACAVAANRPLPVFIDSRLRECDYGDLTRHPKQEVEQQKLLRMTDPFPNGESYEECMVRIHDFLSYLEANYQGKTVLIIGHKATHYGIENFVLKKPLDECISETWSYQPGWKYELN